MNIRYIIVLLVVLLTVLSSFTNYDWGKTGHRVTGEIAEKYLTKTTKDTINKLLKGKGLAFVSTYADEIKSDDRYRGFSPWHYVNFSFDKKYGDDLPSEYGDLAQGIDKCIDVLKDKDATVEDKEFYLKMLVHFVGDLHQPLHVGRSEDKGGNTIQVRWFKDGTNLHRVWDSNMIEYYGMSYTELADNIDQLSHEELIEINKGDVVDWIHESRELAKKVYASAEVGEKLGYKYMYNNFPTLRSQLHKAGIRLAKILNTIYAVDN